MTKTIPLLGFVAYSGTGKTTLLEKIIPLLNEKQIQVGLIKHAHHNFDIDIPGKDSYRLRKAGAQQVLIASNTRQALIIENQNIEKEPDLDQCLKSLQTDKLDLILVEGFKHAAYPKIEINRSDHPQPFIYPDDSNVIAVISDIELTLPKKLPSLNMNNPDEIIAFILSYIKAFK
ncbi:Molybdopterin-guanine dinucleotide biosynthesis protein MobB / Molybdopterin molybdenumtransferase [hydrothermal vent metagenome]|uniref:Molybdopterin-guanine dinucleotide biosynthesis protein MobB / Molybdopterin molybdenumtransferase n=1 Tax=hydrothermal vent metagenome TaxID=652676 RepID=A0A3B1A8M3_9ZZZZ